MARHEPQVPSTTIALGEDALYFDPRLLIEELECQQGRAHTNGVKILGAVLVALADGVADLVVDGEGPDHLADLEGEGEEGGQDELGHCETGEISCGRLESNPGVDLHELMMLAHSEVGDDEPVCVSSPRVARGQKT
jgi:hypothetical protein